MTKRQVSISNDNSSSFKSQVSTRKTVSISEESSILKRRDTNSTIPDAMTNSLYSLSSEKRSFPKKATKAIGITIFACMVNVIFLEYIIKIDKSAGTLITFMQFLFISVSGAFTWWKFGKNKNKVPMRWHILTVILFWSVNVC